MKASPLRDSCLARASNPHLHKSLGFSIVLCSVAGICVICFSALASGQQKPQVTPPTTPSLDFLKHGYLANRESFSLLKCAYTVTKGKVKTMEDLRKGNILDPVVVNVVWIVNKSDEKFEYRCDKTDDGREQPGGTMPANTKGKEIKCLSFGFLNHNDYNLTATPLMKSVNMYAHSDYPGTEFTPFGMGIMARHEYSNPAKYLDESIRGRFNCVVSSPRAGTQVIGIDSGPPAGPERQIYHLDLAKGFLPVYASYGSNGKRRYVAELLESRKFSNDRWFPMRSIVFYYPDAALELHDCVETKILSIDAEAPPSPADFYLDLERGTQVLAAHPKTGWFYLEKDTKVMSSDLESWHDKCQLHSIDPSAILDKLGEHNKSGHSLFFWPAVVTVVTALGIGARRLFRSGKTVAG